MSSISSNRKCLSCQSKNLHNGSIGMYSHTFQPASKDFLSTPYEISAYVCLDCGTLGYYLSTAELEYLREKIAKKNK
jgi:hypothetical protein